MAKPDERFDMLDDICSVPDCGRKLSKLTWCQTHYKRLRTYGDVQAHIPIQRIRPKGLSLEETFRYWMPGHPPSAGIVWPWAGRRTPEGYGTFKFENQTLWAHRTAYEIFREPIPDGLIIRHKNDTPHDVNPWNMELGTRTDNNADKLARGRQSSGPQHGDHSRGVRNYKTRLSEDDVIEIRRTVAAGESTLTALGIRYGLSVAAVCLIVQRKRWRHI